jgi:hypothetical protein
MSTRSLIAIRGKDQYTSIYCHFDGSPEGVGQMLATHYATPEKVTALIALGDLSCLDENLAPAPGQHHSYENRAKGVTVAYGRDRGEADTAPRYDATIKGVKARATKCWAEYLYLFFGGKWQVAERTSRGWTAPTSLAVKLREGA